MLVFPALASAQTVKETDVIGAWEAELEHTDKPGKALGRSGGLVLWPDGLWYYGGAFMYHRHGGARWRLTGDTLWLANDYLLYLHPMIERRINAYKAKGQRDLGAVDMDIISKREPYPVTDSIYWSNEFRDTLSMTSGRWFWVYKVSKRGQRLHLVLLDSLSRETYSVATEAVLTRDSQNKLTSCALYDC